MNCDQFRNRLAGSGALDAQAEMLAHLGGCSGCADLFQRQRRLETSLKEIAARQAGWSAPARLEAMLIEEFRAQSRLQAVPAMPRAQAALSNHFRLPALAAAAALALLLILPLQHSTHTSAGTAGVSQVAETDDDSAADGFVPLPYFANSGEIANVSEDDVVRVEMPRSALVTLGVPVNDDGNSGTVEAELLLGDGGVPQAVRVLE
jgi:hypothetical protein